MPSKPENPKRQRVKKGSVSLPLYEWKNPRNGRTYWRWAWKDQNGRWKYGTRADKSEAIEAAGAQARAINNGRLDLDALSADQLELVRQFLALDPTSEDLRKLREWRQASAVDLAAVVDHWYAIKLAELHGKESIHLGQVKRWYEKLAAHFTGRAGATIRERELREYLEALTANPKSRGDYRSRVISLWKFARTHEHFDSPEADKLPAYKPEAKGHVSHWSPDEMRKLLVAAAEHESGEFLPWLVLAAFSGLRSEEIAPPKKRNKPAFRWEWVKRGTAGDGHGVIDVPANVSKTRKRRLLPITGTLAAWLNHIQQPLAGDICPRLPSKYATAALGEHVGGWRKNDLRHSYGTYRAATLKDLPALAIEMGNSVEKIEEHYREAVSEEVARKFWALTPSEVLRKSKNTP